MLFSDIWSAILLFSDSWLGPPNHLHTSTWQSPQDPGPPTENPLKIIEIWTCFQYPPKHPKATKKEYSGELGSQNDPKMEPKMDPKARQKGSLHKNMKKSIWTTIYNTWVMSTASKSPPFWTTFGICFAPFLETPKQALKNQHKCSILRHLRQNDPQSYPQGSPKGGQNPSTIITNSSLSRRGRPPATFNLKKWSRRVPSPPNKKKEHRPNN